MWSERAQVAEELAELEEREPPAGAADVLAQCTEIVAIELGFPMLENMGIVIATEVARYYAQRGRGLIVDDDDQWFEVIDGQFVELVED